ncbi:hypothetical protein LCGC14_3061020 [marine sediment metagenome]|uniref:Uncharacterized protein n=1 Tax=marine sediment metagenome TaxID=412755 RepID=A0A0F8WIT5_9ZZZZ
MKISQAINELNSVKAKYGDVVLHMEIGEEEECSKCGNSNYASVTGTCRSIGHISVNRESCAYILGDRD